MNGRRVGGPATVVLVVYGTAVVLFSPIGVTGNVELSTRVELAKV